MAISTSINTSTTKIANATVTIAIERVMGVAAAKERTLISIDVPQAVDHRQLELRRMPHPGKTSRAESREAPAMTITCVMDTLALFLGFRLTSGRRLRCAGR